ncbi:MAG TPA: radical SAM/SPASM domain-containing protein [Terriglobia bacterium]|nr:radical SAM/SPASM domain-containing protein [Terriglobia bacterium]
MESIYYVVTFLCHRQCPHCYEDRFRPYHGAELEQGVADSRASFRRIIGNFPDRMTYLDIADSLCEKRGRIILAGGEVLLEPIRESVLYPALEQLHSKYRDRGGVQLIVQTTGDVLTGKILDELLDRHVDVVSVSGIDAFHAGLERESARQALEQKLTSMFLGRGMQPLPAPPEHGSKDEGRRYFNFFGATPESWIGKIWPRGRAWVNELSSATLADNFCNAWSGGLNFLQHRYSGSEVSIEPNGNVYPCCMKTQLAIGNLLEDKLEAILDRLVGNPVYEAISMGHPERMGIEHGWSVEKFLARSKVTLPSGRVYQNLCIGCDAFHREVLMDKKADLVSISTRHVSRDLSS